MEDQIAEPGEAAKAVDRSELEGPRTYTASVACHNCGEGHGPAEPQHLDLPFGRLVRDYACPVCGCFSLKLAT